MDFKSISLASLGAAAAGAIHAHHLLEQAGEITEGYIFSHLPAIFALVLAIRAGDGIGHAIGSLFISFGRYIEKRAGGAPAPTPAPSGDDG